MLLAVNTAQSNGTLGRLVHSAQNFQRYYQDLKQGTNTLNPIERIVFSLVLANSKSPEQTATSDMPVGRT